MLTSVKNCASETLSRDVTGDRVVDLVIDHVVVGGERRHAFAMETRAPSTMRTLHLRPL